MINLHVVDAFADQPFSGNPAADRPIALMVPIGSGDSRAPNLQPSKRVPEAA